jgi:hypothetical protein
MAEFTQMNTLCLMIRRREPPRLVSLVWFTDTKSGGRKISCQRFQKSKTIFATLRANPLLGDFCPIACHWLGVRHKSAVKIHGSSFGLNDTCATVSNDL